jgi:hypothetical protein
MNFEAADLGLIKNLVAKHALCSPVSISEKSRLGEDLRIIGDDAEELLQEFAERFGVDMSCMVFDDYFPCEGTADMHLYLASISAKSSTLWALRVIRLLECLFWQIFAKKRAFITLTVGDLFIAAKLGRWPQKG